MTDTTTEASRPEPVPWTAQVTYQYLQLAERFTAGKHENPALECVRLEPHSRGGVLVIGANGQALSLFYDAAGTLAAPATVRLSPGFLELAGVAYPERPVLLRQPAPLGEWRDGWAVDVIDDDRYPYPNWRGVLPVGPFRGLSTANVSAASVGPVGVLKGTLQLWLCEFEDVILMRSHIYPEFLGVIKTVPNAKRLPAIPDWLQALD